MFTTILKATQRLQREQAEPQAVNKESLPLRGSGLGQQQDAESSEVGYKTLWKALSSLLQVKAPGSLSEHTKLSLSHIRSCRRLAFQKPSNTSPIAQHSSGISLSYGPYGDCVSHQGFQLTVHQFAILGTWEARRA